MSLQAHNYNFKKCNKASADCPLKDIVGKHCVKHYSLVYDCVYSGLIIRVYRHNLTKRILRVGVDGKVYDELDHQIDTNKALAIVLS